jgi:4-hydroxy-3-methylbut-2-enyl diphosphate reductase
MIIEVDQKSGFCFGVVNAIKKAEEALETEQQLFSLGDIVHNETEVSRLNERGLTTIQHTDLNRLQNTKILIRAHGEPPSTYQLAAERNLTLIDATCPVVLHLQKKIRDIYVQQPKASTQIVIFGKKGHAEVNGLIGQTENTAVVIEKEEDIRQLELTKNTYLFSQTTQPIEGFNDLVAKLQHLIQAPAQLIFTDSICRQVSNRIPHIRQFAKKHDIVVFVSGKKSSNGKVLFTECQLINKNSFFISEVAEVKNIPLQNATSIGICGATSTPMWLMEAVAKELEEITKIS